MRKKTGQLIIGLPVGKPRIAAAMFLSFIESYNLLEQPMAFISLC